MIPGFPQCSLAASAHKYSSLPLVVSRRRDISLAGVNSCRCECFDGRVNPEFDCGLSRLGGPW
jgi:hypothetical protein